MPAGLGQLAIRCLCFKFPRGETGSWLKWGSRVPCHAMPCHACIPVHTLLAYYIYYIIWLYAYIWTIYQWYILYYIHIIFVGYIYIHNTCANLCFYLHLKPRYDSLQGIPLSVGSWFGGPRLLIDVEPQSVQGEPRLWLDLVWANNLSNRGTREPLEIPKVFFVSPQNPRRIQV